ncbi:hypothetical protein BC828DRAFT_373364 [Blastocladiella britannica]|nr:hypothetical protein BC828DRAFT_373364 [Blastocladiella britannica]
MLSAGVIPLGVFRPGYQTDRGLAADDLLEWLRAVRFPNVVMEAVSKKATNRGNMSNHQCKNLNKTPRKQLREQKHDGTYESPMIEQKERLKRHYEDVQARVRTLMERPKVAVMVPPSLPTNMCERCHTVDVHTDLVALFYGNRKSSEWMCSRCRDVLCLELKAPQSRDAGTPMFMCLPRCFETARLAAERFLDQRLDSHWIFAAHKQSPLLLNKLDGPPITSETDAFSQGFRAEVVGISPEWFVDVCGLRVTQLVCHLACLVDDLDLGAKMAVFCECLQQINLLHDALVCAGVRCATIRHGIHTCNPLRAFKIGLAPGTTEDGDPIDTRPVSVLILPYSVCDASLSLTEATHVIMSHPYAGPDVAVKSMTFKAGQSNTGMDWLDADRGTWSEERWDLEREKWREIERRAVACIVQPGQSRSVQVTRVYAAFTREANLATEFGNPMEFNASGQVIAAVGQDQRNRYPAHWVGNGTNRSTDAAIYANCRD